MLNVKFSSDYIDFIKHFGRAWADIEIFAFEGNETVVGYTQSLREVHAETSENYAVADDGAGNPIMINPKGEVLIFYHDNGENEILASSLEVFSISLIKLRMKVKQQIINFYQILKELPDNEEYNVEGIRNRVSMKADNLLFTLDNKGNQGIDIDAKIFSFLSFVKGYDMPRFEDNYYLFTKEDLDREYKALGDIESLNGNEIDC